MRRLVPLLPLLLVLGACAGTGPGLTPEEATLVHPGDPAPAFALPTVDGGTFDLAAQRGKVVVVNFFATWCPPCREEMPHLKSDVWERFRGDGFALVSVAREETAAEVAPFAAEHGADWPFALDTERAAFARYAEAYIPRSFVVDRDGTVVFHLDGYDEDRFAAMVDAVAAALARP